MDHRRDRHSCLVDIDRTDAHGQFRPKNTSVDVRLSLQRNNMLQLFCMEIMVEFGRLDER